jgi:hypothetical protein
MSTIQSYISLIHEKFSSISVEELYTLWEKCDYEKEQNKQNTIPSHPVPTFFNTYHKNNIPLYDKEETIEYRRTFLQKWYSIPSMTIPLFPIASSPLVCPPHSTLDKELLDTKKKIDLFHQFDSIKEKFYYSMSRLMDPFAFYKKKVQHLVYPNHSMTNAWLKCWEMIHTFELVPREGNFNVFCNAEFPGAFLFAINHLVRTKTRATFDWTANSLYPSDKNGSVLGDTFGLYRRYPQKWCMDATHSGDVTKQETIQRIKERCGRSVDLYTSDIGMEMTHDTFEKQETLEAPLHLGQVVCGLHVLRPGGNLVCKTFMFFSPFSISLLYLMSQCFEEFYITKPETSRPLNSEVYVVGKRFRIREDIVTQLEEILFSWKEEYMDNYIVPVPEDFYLSVWMASHRIFGRQIEYITSMIDTVGHHFSQGLKPDFFSVQHYPLCKKEQERLRTWVQRYPIPPLGKEYSL